MGNGRGQLRVIVRRMSVNAPALGSHSRDGHEHVDKEYGRVRQTSDTWIPQRMQETIRKMALLAEG